MTGISDQFTTIGNEAVDWGTTAATLTRGIEAKATKVTHRVERRYSSGFRPGRLGHAHDTVVVDKRGGTYTLTHDVLSKSQGMVFGSIGTLATTTPGGATNARLHTVTPSDYSIPSRSILDAVLLSDGTLDYVSYLGCKATSLKLSVSPKGNVEATTEFDFKTCDTAASSVSPSYPSSPYVYRDLNVTTAIGGTDVCQRTLDVTIPSGVKIDLDRICPGGREEPKVADVIVPTGSLSVDMASVSYLSAFLTGSQQSLTITIDSGIEIESGQANYKIVLTFPAVIFTGDGYNRSMTDLTEQPLPWEAVDNSTDPLWKIEVHNADATA